MAKAEDYMIRSTAGSNTDKWAGKKYKGKSKKSGKPVKRKKLKAANATHGFVRKNRMTDEQLKKIREAKRRRETAKKKAAGNTNSFKKKRIKE
tara:strand:- start:4230 stop:4508 length:279 start_codon:yes stop_codon:yes gene_type:complete